MALNVWQLPFEKEKALLKLQIAIKTRDTIKAEYETELERGLNPKSKKALDYKTRINDLKHRINFWGGNE